jgi:hypothetical protein
MKFFDQAEISAFKIDKQNRSAIFSFHVPLFLAHASFPVLLSSGSIETFSLPNPISSFIPKIENSSAGKNLETRIRKNVQEALSIFLESKIDMTPVLPVGVYVDFLYKCQVDKLIRSISFWEIKENLYELEFKQALTKVSNDLIIELNKEG